MKAWLFSMLLFFGVNSLWGSDQEWVVGTASAYPPFVSLDTEGQYRGFDIDLSERIAKKLGRKLVLKDLGSMPSLFLALKQGKVDALIWGISITEERQKIVDMIHYQGDLVTSMPVIFWKAIPEEIRTMEDLKKWTKGVCVEAGSYQESVLKAVPGIQLKYLDKITDVLLDIKTGKSLCSAVDPSIVLQITSQNPEIKVLQIPLPPNQQSLGNGICISRSNQALAAQVRKAVQELREEGEIAALEKKWKLR